MTDVSSSLVISARAVSRPFSLCFRSSDPGQALPCACGKRALVPCGHSTLLCWSCHNARPPLMHCPDCGAGVQRLKFQDEILVPRQPHLVPLLPTKAAGSQTPR